MFLYDGTLHLATLIGCQELTALYRPLIFLSHANSRYYLFRLNDEQTTVASQTSLLPQFVPVLNFIFNWAPEGHTELPNIR
jgi:hypothetical protein